MQNYIRYLFLYNMKNIDRNYVIFIIIFIELVFK